MNVSPYCWPIGVSGLNWLFGLVKILKNGAKFGSFASFGEALAAFVVGRFLSRFESPTSASVSVARYLISSHASSGCFEPLRDGDDVAADRAGAVLAGLASRPPGTARSCT